MEREFLKIYPQKGKWKQLSLSDSNHLSGYGMFWQVWKKGWRPQDNLDIFLLWFRYYPTDPFDV